MAVCPSNCIIYHTDERNTQTSLSKTIPRDPSNYITRENDDMIRALFGLVEPSRKQMSSTSWDTIQKARDVSLSLSIFICEFGISMLTVCILLVLEMAQIPAGMS